MPTVTIDGRPLEFEKGDTVIRVARRHGIDVPYYCWHPGLSIAANCRICLVDVEKQPKLQPACQWPCADGMVVHTQNDRVLAARKAVQEFLLLNHPVDCPICDQAGECKLQDYWQKLDRQQSRLYDEREKVHKPKAVTLGPEVVLDNERCILCTRCVRFCDEVAKDPVLAVRQRGDHGEIFCADGRELDHRYSLMTVQICPVGALTSRDFRFQARVWFLESTDTICPGCATGCNAHLDVSRGTAYRMRARENPDVNRFWMCDDGCMTYKRIHESRVLRAATGRGEARTAVSLSAGIAAAAKAIESVPRASVGVVLSAQHTVEDNEALAALAKSIGAGRLYLSGRANWEGDEILRSADQNPNRMGAIRAAGDSPPASFDELLADVKSGRTQALVVLGQDAPTADGRLDDLDGLDAFVLLASNDGPLLPHAQVILPVSSFAEVAGTFVNAKGNAQSLRPALTPRGDSLPAHEVGARLARALAPQVAKPAMQATAP
jgi:NADH-quinone oxidoreductase subunit G